jgi:uncharacterized membrane protein
MPFLRMLRHLCATRSGTRRRFSRDVIEAIEQAVAAAESRSSGEIRFAIDTALELPDIWADKSPRDCAHEAFTRLRVWDSELNNGVLIYVLMADRDVEIVADRGAAARISPAEWEAACRLMESHFRAGQFREGSLVGVQAVGELLEREFPCTRAANRDELPNQPALL